MNKIYLLILTMIVGIGFNANAYDFDFNGNTGTASAHDTWVRKGMEKIMTISIGLKSLFTMMEQYNLL